MTAIRLVPFGDQHHDGFVAMLADPDVTRFTPLPYPVPPYPIAEEVARFRTEAARAAKHSLGPWTEKYPEVEVSVEVVEGSAARELVEASRTAGLLVVGTRGHGGLAGMLLGSVSQAVLRHAQSPVVIAR